MDLIGKIAVEDQLRLHSIIAEMETANAFVSVGISQPALQNDARFKIMRAAERLAALLPAFEPELRGRACPLFSAVRDADVMPLDFLK